jgi:multidrug efflux pump subunit AcrA (membrane-fusion protein)
MEVQRKVDLAGTLMSPDQARVSAEAAGIVRQVAVEIGREVRAGDPLVRLETKELALARSPSIAPRARCARRARSSACTARSRAPTTRPPTTRSDP